MSSHHFGRVALSTKPPSVAVSFCFAIFFGLPSQLQRNFQHLNLSLPCTIFNLFHLSANMDSCMGRRRCLTNSHLWRKVGWNPNAAIGVLEKLFSSLLMTAELGTWSIIPFSKWLITMVSKSPNWGYSPSTWPRWLINGGYQLLTNWDDPPSRELIQIWLAFEVIRVLHTMKVAKTLGPLRFETCTPNSLP